MARKRIEGGLKSWAAADEALLAIGRSERLIEALEAQAQRQIELIREATVAAVKPEQERRAALELQLQAWCEAHRDEFQGKSRVLNFGTVSFRQSTRIVIRGLAACIEALRNLGLPDYVRVKESPDKEKLKDLDDATLSQVGAKRHSEDVFGYEVNREKIMETA